MNSLKRKKNIIALLIFIIAVTVTPWIQLAQPFVMNNI